MVKKGLLGILLLGLLFIGLRGFIGLGEGLLESGASYVTYPFLTLSKTISAPYISWRSRRALMNNLIKE